MKKFSCLFKCILLLLPMGCQVTPQSLSHSMTNLSTSDTPRFWQHNKSIQVALGKFLSQPDKFSLGKELNEEDQRLVGDLAKQVLEYSSEDVESFWENPSNDHKGQLKVLRTEGLIATNLVCRDFEHVLSMMNGQEVAQARACRDMWSPEGEWVLQG